MRRAWRVAVREYLENAKTKGFWIGIILFPVMILVFSQVPQFLEDKATPTRTFILVDRSEEFGPLVENGGRYLTGIDDSRANSIDEFFHIDAV